MPIVRRSGLVVLALAAGACAQQAGDVAPVAGFLTTTEAVACAQEALVNAGFHPQTESDAPTPRSVSGRIVTQRQRDRVTANAAVRVGVPGDTTVALTVTAKTLELSSDDPDAWGTVQQLSGVAVRGRDAS